MQKFVKPVPLYAGSLEDFQLLSQTPDFYDGRWSVAHVAQEDPIKRTVFDDPDTPHSDESLNELFVHVSDNVDEQEDSFLYYRISHAMRWIHERLQLDKNVLVHCSMGISRSPSICIAYLASTGMLPNGSFADARKGTDYVSMPSLAMSEFFNKNWARLMRR